MGVRLPFVGIDDFKTSTHNSPSCRKNGDGYNHDITKENFGRSIYAHALTNTISFARRIDCEFYMLKIQQNLYLTILVFLMYYSNSQVNCQIFECFSMKGCHVIYLK